MQRARTRFARVAGTLAAALAFSQFAACTAQPPREAARCDGSEQPAERLFLQQVTDRGALLRWRGPARAICVGTDPAALDTRVEAVEEGGHLRAALQGLRPDTVYYYSVGAAARAPEAQRFRTAPRRGQVPADGLTRVLLLGDSGTATESVRGKASHQGEALRVKAGLQRWIAANAGDPDLLLLLGDNAYLEGTDAQWQGAFFDIYPEWLRTMATWPTIGNHEMGASLIDLCALMPLPDCAKGPIRMPLGGTSESTDPASYDSDGNGPDGGGPPYLSIFELPAGAEAGGVPSGTEQYYAFDYANLHVVSLDSQLSARDPAQREAMRRWLVDDLQANRQDWTVVIFHHPPYSKGVNHDSDVEQAEIDMRETFGPVFEEHGVDAVFSGHAHSYERSWYLKGHQGPSDTFDAAAHAELNASGQPAIGQGEEGYRQLSPSTRADDRVVYAVAGSAGKADAEKPCAPGQTMLCTLPGWLQHPAHRRFEAGPAGYRPNGIARLGAVVLDVGPDTLTSRFVDEHGEVLDWFTITR